MTMNANALTELVKRLDASKEWKVSTKFAAPADLSIPSGKAKGGETCDGGEVVIKEYQQDEKEEIYVLTWVDESGCTGLYVRMLDLLPIQRGKDKEANTFRFSSIPGSVEESIKKCLFVIKFHTLEKADDFENWWKQISGETAIWTAKEEGSDISALEPFFRQMKRDLDEIVHLTEEKGNDSEPSSSPKRKSKDCTAPKELCKKQKTKELDGADDSIRIVSKDKAGFNGPALITKESDIEQEGKVLTVSSNDEEEDRSDGNGDEDSSGVTPNNETSDSEKTTNNPSAGSIGDSSEKEADNSSDDDDSYCSSTTPDDLDDSDYIESDDSDYDEADSSDDA